MRLSRRLTVVFGLVGLVTVAGVAGLAWWMSAHEIRESVDDELRQRLAPAQRMVDRIGDVEELPVLPDELPVLDPESGLPGPFIEEGGPAQVQFIGRDGVVLGGVGITPSPAALASLNEPEQYFETVVLDGVDHRVATVRIEFDGGDELPAGMQVFRDLSNENQAIDDLAVRLALLGLLGVTTVTVAGWLIGRWLARPVLDLSDRAEQLARLDDLPARVELSRNDEVGRLAESFNRVLAALEIGREQQQRLVADASHELRTPLTGVRMRLEYLCRSVDDPAQQSILDGAITDAEQLTALVGDLVDLATDVRSADEPLQETDLAAIVREVAEQSRTGSGREIDLIVEGGSALVMARPTMVRRAVRNLIDNAVKYAATGPIEVHLRDDGITVHDAGPGVALDDREHVFDRFYRSPKARWRPGNGIGLAIVQQVADSHHGRTWVEASHLGGAAIGFSLSETRAPTRRHGVDRFS